MAFADIDTGGVGFNQRQGNPQFLFFTDQMLRVVEFKGQTQHRRHRPQGDVTFFPVKTNPQHIILAIEMVATHHAGVIHCGGIAAIFRAG